MKLKFEKNKAEETIVTVDEKTFVSQNYIDMIKQLHAGNDVEVEFGDGVTTEEQNSINEMVRAINSIDTKIVQRSGTHENGGAIEYQEEEINPDDIPF